jgi:hypothetical protein
MLKCYKCLKPLPGSNGGNAPWLCRVCKEKVTAEKDFPSRCSAA